MTSIIGKITLDISVILYLINYIPQLWHNYKGGNLPGLSVHFHVLLFLSYVTDVFYGLGFKMPWQYLIVSFSSCFCLCIQHYQIHKVSDRRFFSMVNIVFSGVFILGMGLLFFGDKSSKWFLLFGYVSQALGFICVLPQIVKNTTFLSALSLSIVYLLLDFCCDMCDVINGWIFSWPLPSRLGAIFAVMIDIVIIGQQVHATYIHRKMQRGESMDYEPVLRLQQDSY